MNVEEFNYLGTAVQSNRDCRREVKKRVQEGEGVQGCSEISYVI